MLAPFCNTVDWDYTNIVIVICNNNDNDNNNSIMGCHCQDGWGSWASDSYKMSDKTHAKFSLWQSSATPRLFVVELFGTKRRMVKGKKLVHLNKYFGYDEQGLF